MRLVLSARLYGGRFHGRTRNGEAEWPPSPRRLYCALVATAYRMQRPLSDAVRRALLMLERLDPPTIVAAPVAGQSCLQLYVPMNSRKREPQRQKKTIMQQVLGAGAMVHFVWCLPPGVEAEARVLCEVAGEMEYLGTSCDHVAAGGRLVDDVEAFEGDWWVPAAGSDSRAPAPGLLEELDRRHARMVSERRITGTPIISTGRRVSYRRRGQEGRRAYAFALDDLAGGRVAIDPREAILVAAWARHAAIECAPLVDMDAGYVSGHGDDRNRRISYLPLPTIAPKGREGRIRRVLLAEPTGLARGRRLSQAMAGAYLTRLGELEPVAALSPTTAERDAVVARYVSASRTWATVTPVVMPGHYRQRGRERVRVALERAGIGTPVRQIELRRAPAFPGAMSAEEYGVPQYLRGSHRAHAIIEFAEPATGPLAIGSGCHVGLGLMAPLQ
jgi:CRISPR-associated protein Csb2